MRAIFRTRTSPKLHIWAGTPHVPLGSDPLFLFSACDFSRCEVGRSTSALAHAGRTSRPNSRPPQRTTCRPSKPPSPPRCRTSPAAAAPPSSTAGAGARPPNSATTTVLSVRLCLSSGLDRHISHTRSQTLRPPSSPRMTPPRCGTNAWTQVCASALKAYREGPSHRVTNVVFTKPRRPSRHPQRQSIVFVDCRA